MADSIQTFSLYSGSGMLDEAVSAGLELFGLRTHVLGFCEREAHAAAWLLARMEAQTLERAPVFCGDLADMDARPLRGFVDLLTASPPCQPYSIAGKRRGNADERSHGDGDGPLPHTVRIIDECRPAVVFFENVPEWVTGGHFRGFGEELFRLGYDIAPPLFIAAEDVGAPHKRERVFILGHQRRGGFDWPFPQCGSVTSRVEWDAERSSRELGHAGCDPGERNAGAVSRTQTGVDRSRELDGCVPVGLEYAGAEVGNAERAEPQAGIEGEQAAGIGRGGYADAGDELANADISGCDIRRNERRGDSQGIAGPGRLINASHLQLFPPGRNDYRRWAELVAGGLDAACMPAVERGFPALADGLAGSNSDVLRLGGNGVVPLAASVAFAVLLGGVVE